MKFIIGITGFLLFTGMLIYNVNTVNTGCEAQKSLANISIIANMAIADDGEWVPCYNFAESCWFWNCTYINHCGSCLHVSSDNWWSPATCWLEYMCC